MKRSILFIGLIFSLILIGGVLAADFKQCNKECVNETQIKMNECKSNFTICSNNAKISLKQCNSYSGTNKTTCVKNSRTEMNKCTDDKKTCLKDIDNSVNRCKKKCFYAGKNITCENGTYDAGQEFLQGCKKCECGYNGKISCKDTEYCNFESPFISKETCETGNGLYQQLCSGTLYSMKCTSETYCQCDGNFNYSCPNGYLCTHNFLLNQNKKGQFTQGWRKLPQIPIGDIGICVKKPELNNCGNGICEEIVCMALNCPTPETIYNCPQDCKN